MKTQYRLDKWGGNLMLVAVDLVETPLGPATQRRPVKYIWRNTSYYTPGAEHPAGAPARRRWYQMQAQRLGKEWRDE